jgi:hypothetical protein
MSNFPNIPIDKLFETMPTIDNEYKKTAIEFYKLQVDLIAEQKEYSLTVKNATKWMAIATGVIALATLAQVIILIIK